MTSFDAFTGQNFRRGGFLHRDDRYVRAEEFVRTARQLWDSWADDAIVADRERGQFLADGDIGRFSQQGRQFDIGGQFSVPRPRSTTAIFKPGWSGWAGRPDR